MTKNKKNIKTLLKFIVTIFLLFYLFKKIDFSLFKENLIKVNLFYLLIVLLIDFIGLIISSFKLKFILNIKKINVKYLKVFLAYHSGSFFNTFFPSSIGGDIIKISLINEKTKRLAKITSAVLLDRILGVFALILISILGFLFILLKYDLNKNYLIVFLCFVFFLFISIFVFIFLIKKSKKIMLLEKSISDNLLRKMFIKIINFLIEFRTYLDKKNYTYILISFLISFVFQVLTIFVPYVVSKSLGFKISFHLFLVITPIINIILMLPFSINGMGLRELSYSLFWGLVGISLEDSLSISSVSFFVLMIFNFLGGVSYLLLNILNNKEKNDNT